MSQLTNSSMKSPLVLIFLVQFVLSANNACSNDYHIISMAAYQNITFKMRPDSTAKVSVCNPLSDTTINVYNSTSQVLLCSNCTNCYVQAYDETILEIENLNSYQITLGILYRGILSDWAVIIFIVMSIFFAICSCLGIIILTIYYTKCKNKIVDNPTSQTDEISIPDDQTIEISNDQTIDLPNDQTIDLPNDQTIDLPNDQTGITLSTSNV